MATAYLRPAVLKYGVRKSLPKCASMSNCECFSKASCTMSTITCTGTHDYTNAFMLAQNGEQVRAHVLLEEFLCNIGSKVQELKGDCLPCKGPQKTGCPVAAEAACPPD